MVRFFLFLLTAFFGVTVSGMSLTEKVKNRSVSFSKVASLQDICARTLAVDFESKESFPPLSNNLREIITDKIIAHNSAAWWSYCQRKPLNHQPVNFNEAVGLSADCQVLIFNDSKLNMLQVVNAYTGVVYNTLDISTIATCLNTDASSILMTRVCISEDKSMAMLQFLNDMVVVWFTPEGDLTTNQDYQLVKVDAACLGNSVKILHSVLCLDKSFLITVLSDGSIAKFNPTTGKFIAFFDCFGKSAVNFWQTLAISVDSQLIAAGFNDGVVLIWSSKNHELLLQINVRMNTDHYENDHPMSLAISCDNRFIVIGTYWGTLAVFDLAVGKATHIFQHNDRDNQSMREPSCCSLSNDDSLLCVCSRSGALVLWDLISGSAVLRLNELAAGAAGVSLNRMHLMVITDLLQASVVYSIEHLIDGKSFEGLFNHLKTYKALANIVRTCVICHGLLDGNEYALRCEHNQFHTACLAKWQTEHEESLKTWAALYAESDGVYHTHECPVCIDITPYES